MIRTTNRGIQFLYQEIRIEGKIEEEIITIIAEEITIKMETEIIQITIEALVIGIIVLIPIGMGIMEIAVKKATQILRAIFEVMGRITIILLGEIINTEEKTQITIKIIVLIKIKITKTNGTAKEEGIPIRILIRIQRVGTKVKIIRIGEITTRLKTTMITGAMKIIEIGIIILMDSQVLINKVDLILAPITLGVKFVIKSPKFWKPGIQLNQKVELSMGA